MCLSRTISQYESVPDEDGPEFGWKVFVVGPPEETNQPPTLQGIFFQTPSITEKTVIENPCRRILLAGMKFPRDYLQMRYDSGFHIYLVKEHALETLGRYLSPNAAFAVLRRVSYWGRITHGMENDSPVVVSQYMLVHEDETEA